MKTEITQMREWLDNRDAHSGKIRKAELRYIRAKCQELEAQYKDRFKTPTVCQAQGSDCLVCVMQNCGDRLYARRQ